MKMKYWNKKKEKKARFKRSLARAKKRKELIFCGFITITDKDIIK